MSKLTPDELERRTSEAEERFRESIEYVTEDDIEAAARSGEEKIRRLEKAVPQALTALWSDVKLLVSMIRDYGTGAYRDVPFATIAAAVAAILYLVSPIDAIPDFIPVLGYMDDAAVIGVCIRMAHNYIQQYRQWKDTSAPS
jgi:uncharacterized membrane protein YkvA (DUF1232 family)